MKGLLIKDFKLIFSNARMLVVIVCIAFFMLFGSDTMDGSFVVSYLTIISFMFVLTSISYDDFDHGLSFLLTLPVSRKTYVREKYCFGLLCGFGGWFLALLLCLISGFVKNSFVPLSDFMLTSIMVYVILTFMLTITIPIQLKFGGDNGKILIMILIGVLFAMGLIVSRIAGHFHVDLTKWMDHLFALNSAFLILISVFLALTALVVSYLVSLRVMDKKQL